MIGRSNLFVRKAAWNLARYHDHGGVPGGNLPFSINNRFKLTALFVLFFGSGFSAPFLILRHQLLKK
ncbi:cytochrome c oxidase subunit 7C, mitochondrial-like [Anoplophora glabripennis]|uniref:cytochrome c oxidase subunit 7C, mitochondrial-like n=1 Tax=Anoplophora glabripennis TaxID=217634 RepID=UPI00087377A7|nr:cytochrome c oxidase subunit 7C, mitochondrial-like [Anoplophora glabripennis]